VAHRVVQWLAVFGVIALLALPLLSRSQQTYPAHVRIAAGAPQGEYYKFAAALSDVLIGETQGSAGAQSTAGAVENLELLLAGDAEAGLLQASAVSPFPDQLAVVAPLFQEYVSIIVDADATLDHFDDLNGRQVLVGSPSSGMQLSAHQVVKKLSLNIEAVHEDFTQLRLGEQKAAIVTSGLDNASLRRILSTGRFRLLSFDREQILLLTELDVFRPRIMPSSSLGDGVPGGDVLAISTRTYLVVDKEANREYVTDLLDAVTRLAERFQIESLIDRTDWGPFPLHPAAKQFFDEGRAADE
jgi:TRAP transporter TAXI family solute receptor